MKIKEVIRLFEECGLSKSRISKALNISRPVVIQYIAEFELTGLKYADIKNMPDEKFLELFNVNKEPVKSERYQNLFEKFPFFVRELKRSGVTLMLLWNEYKQEHPTGYGYAQFCYHYQIWKSTAEVSMHIEHKAGDKMFVDYAGDTFPVIDPETRKVSQAEVFVAILGASELTFAVATRDQKTPSWIWANIAALEYFNGVPQAIVPDCTKTAVSKSDAYEPDINPEYQLFAEHYGTVIFPTRPRHPKDKALVENAVRLIYQRVFAPLRNREFYSIEELNKAIREKIDEHNNRPMTKLKISRRELYNQVEKSVLKPLPATPYEFKNVVFPTIQVNYHVYLPEDKHYYSVPFYLRKQNKKAKILYSQTNVEIFHKGIRVASYQRDRIQHKYTTRKEHMPPNHQFMSEWSPERITNWALKISKNTAEVVQNILSSRMYPEQAYKTCIGIIGLAKYYGDIRLDKACQIALEDKGFAYKRIKNILAKGIDKIEDDQLTFEPLPVHENIRGSAYYDETLGFFKTEEKGSSVAAL